LTDFLLWQPIYATISDIVVYSPKGPTSNAIALAERFKIAIEKKAAERLARLRKDSTTQDDLEANGLLTYNVFVLSATADEIRETLPHLIIRRIDSSSSSSTTPTTASSIPSFPPNTVDFDKRERDEMRDLTKASEIISVYPSKEAEEQACLKAKAEGRDMSATSMHWDPHVGQAFLGNSNDIPRATEAIPPTSELFHQEFSDNDVEMAADAGPGAKTKDHSYTIDADPFNFATNDPADGLGYDICVESTDIPPFTSAAHLRAAEDHLQMLDTLWAQRCRRNQTTEEGELPPRPPPNANAVIHLAFPCSSLSCGMNRNVIVLVVKFLQRVLQPPPFLHQFPSPVAQQQASTAPTRVQRSVGSRRWSSAMQPTSPNDASPSSDPVNATTSTTTPNSLPTSTLAQPTRPLKVLIHSFDGYTESSIPALCLLMAVKGLSLPEAYLELQVVKKRSFFVYHADLWVLRAAEAKFRESEGDTGNVGAISAGDGKTENGVRVQNPFKRPAANSVSSSSFADFQSQSQSQSQGFPSAPPNPHAHSHAFTHSRSQSFSELDSDSESTTAAPQINIGNSNSSHNNQAHVRSRPRASTSPWLPSLFKDHQAWFNDPRFDGSFPSRVLPFLYLGNL
jgi:dual specificity MAP kinase phosphatase